MYQAKQSGFLESPFTVASLIEHLKRCLVPLVPSDHCFRNPLLVLFIYPLSLLEMASA